MKTKEEIEIEIRKSILKGIANALENTPNKVGELGFTEDAFIRELIQSYRITKVINNNGAITLTGFNFKSTDDLVLEESKLYYPRFGYITNEELLIILDNIFIYTQINS